MLLGETKASYLYSLFECLQVVFYFRGKRCVLDLINLNTVGWKVTTTRNQRHTLDQNDFCGICEGLFVANMNDCKIKPCI